MKKRDEQTTAKPQKDKKPAADQKRPKDLDVNKEKGADVKGGAVRSGR